MQVKVCGIQNCQEMNLAVNSGADAVGFVSQMPSGDYQLSLNRIRELGQFVADQVSKILLTSRLTAYEILQDLEYVKFNHVQICQLLKEDEYKKLRSLNGLKVYQSIHVHDNSALSCAATIAPYVDFVILDSGNPFAPFPQLGGTGKIHDWSVSREIVKQLSTPVFLAGGLKPDNLQAAIQSVNPYGVDVCSGVRSGFGLDESVLSSFLQIAKSGSRT